MKQRGSLRLTGTYDDLTFYRVGDKYYARKRTSISRRRFKQDPAFETQRNNASEFSGVVMMGMLLRERVLGHKNKGLHDRKGRGNLTRILTAMVKEGSGLRGQRTLELRKFKDMLQGYNFLGNSVLNPVFDQTPSISVNSDRTEVTITFRQPALKGDFPRPVRPDAGRFTLYLGVVSDVAFHPQHEKYRPLHEPRLHPVVVHSPEQQLNTSSTITLTAILPAGRHRPAN